MGRDRAAAASMLWNADQTSITRPVCRRKRRQGHRRLYFLIGKPDQIGMAQPISKALGEFSFVVGFQPSGLTLGYL